MHHPPHAADLVGDHPQHVAARSHHQVRHVQPRRVHEHQRQVPGAIELGDGIERILVDPEPIRDAVHVPPDAPAAPVDGVAEHAPIRQRHAAQMPELVIVVAGDVRARGPREPLTGVVVREGRRTVAHQTILNIVLGAGHRPA